ncbi:hypothetical protein GGF37_006352, partial [Kickxella alabastrina]
MKRDILSTTISRASKLIDTKHISNPILRDRMARPIESFFGAYPEGYSFGDKELKYNSVAEPVNYFGAFVEMFQSLNPNKAVKTISLFPMRTSIVPGFTTIDKTILAKFILSVIKSRLRALHKDSLCLDIEIPEIP